MLRDMQWEDVDGDTDLDMILAGDWMPLKIFINDRGTFQELQDAFGSEQTSGWWNCIATGDFDGDGDPDFVAGNHGLNSRFRASAERPVSMYVNDFDRNGSAEQIICVYEGDSAYPLALKHDLTQQIPALLKKYPTYEMYREQTIRDIFAPEQLANAIQLDVTRLETSLFINDGTGHFSSMPLPLETQFSTVMAAEAGDYNGDGHTDLVLGGNLYRVKPEVGRYDASYGNFLAGDGTGAFRAIPSYLSGLRLEGEVRDIHTIRTAQGTLLLVARNNDPLQILRIREP